MEPDQAISDTVNYLTQPPDQLQGDLHEVEIHKLGGQEVTGKEGVAADAKDWKIRFFDGTKNLNQATFDHEFGHIVGDATEDRQAGIAEKLRERIFGHEFDGAEAYAPEGYSDAAGRDKKPVSEYGQTNVAEDFGDFWRDYSKAQR